MRIVLLPLLAAKLAASSERPNILYIFTDDHTYRMVSCYPRAYEFADTPNIDRLAEQGVRFDQAYMGAKCRPSRATVLTGRLQFAVESDYAGNEIPGSIHWFPTIRQEGYYTGVIGKWHYYGDEGTQHGTSWDWSVIWRHAASDARGDNYYDGQWVSIDGAPQEPLNGYSTDRYADFTEQFIQERADDPDSPPWFYWLAFAGVHSPYTPADRHVGTLDDEPAPPIPVDIYGPRLGKTEYFQDSKWTQGADGRPYHKNRSLEFWTKQQMEAILSIDDAVGRIVQKLEDTGQLENTIIVFSSDQGYVWGQHGLKGKIDPYETAIRSPFIVSNPARFPIGEVSKAPINVTDLIQTFHAWAEAEPQQFMPGRDITPLIENPASAAVLSEWAEVPTMMTYVGNRYEPTEIANRLRNEEWDRLFHGSGVGYAPYYFMILVENYKYTRHANPDQLEELYDLDNDPEELVNLAIQPQYQAKVLEMRAACVQSIKDNGGSVFADLLPPPSTEEWWPAGIAPSDNAHALFGSAAAQDDSETLMTRNGWGSADSRLAYLRFNLSGVDEIGGTPADSILSVSLDLWLTQTEGDSPHELQVFALLDGAQDSPSSLSETGWTGSTGANPLVSSNLPHGADDPVSSPLASTLLGTHSFAASGDNDALGLIQIDLTTEDFKSLLGDDSNGEITLILRSTSQGLSTNFASVSNSNSEWAAPALTVTAIPPPPTGLNATPGDGRVALSWEEHPSPSLASYNVYRSTILGSYGAPLATEVNTNSYVDDDVVNDTTYYYQVTAVDTDGNESAPSDEAAATPEPFSLSSDAFIFGSDNAGLAGFTQSSIGSDESWSIRPDSVRYRNQDNGTENASLLREFPLDRSVGASYTVEGILDLTDGYAEDNNRIAIYLFGDQADLGVAPGEDETGALSLLYNLEHGELRLHVGIDESLLLSENSGRVRDDSIFGNEVRLTAEISFIEIGSTKHIRIDGRFIDEFGTITELSHTVRAADYPGDWFGFATRSRSRDHGSGGAKSAPFVVDYKSFYISPPLSDYQQWAKDQGIGSEALESADFDGDGFTNLFEYGLDGDPFDPMDHGTDPVFSGLGNDFTFVYPKRSDTDSLIYTVLTSTDLTNGSWTETRYTVGETDVTGGPVDFVTVHLDTSESNLFIRLTIKQE